MSHLFKHLSRERLLYIMKGGSAEQQLRAAEEYSKTLEEHFRNNLEVIEEREHEIQQLNAEMQRMQREYQGLIDRLEQQQSENQLEVRLVRSQCLQKLEQREKEMEEVATMIEIKMRKQMDSVAGRLSQEVKSARSQVLDRDETNRRLIHENGRLAEIIKDQKGQLFEMEQQVTQLVEEKNAMSSKMAMHEQELEGIKNCNTSWEEMLKDKLKEAQREKQAVEEEYSDYKLTVKEKLKKQKEDLNKKVLQISEEKEAQVREIVHQNKEMRYKLDKTMSELRDSSKELQLLRDQRSKLQSMLTKYKEHELKSNFEKNQKEYDYLLKIFEQDKRDLKSQIDIINQEKKTLKDEHDDATKKLEAAQQSVERLKKDSLSKAKENDDLRKENKKLEARLKESDSKEDGVEKEQPSKVFTDDLGEINEKFFLQSPKNKAGSYVAANQNREAQLMKKVSQLQLEAQEYKNLVKSMREELESLKRFSEEEKNKEVALYRDKANIYWEKANDKEQQIMNLREQLNELKATYNEVNAELRRIKDSQSQHAAKQQELVQLRERIAKLEEQKKELEEEVEIITRDRDLIEEISSQLRTENHSLREMMDAGNYIQNYSKSNLQHPYKSSIEEVPPREEETIPNYYPQPERQKIPKKLHDLVREKKLLSVSGKRAAIEQRMTETRLQHVGTQSQKEVLQKIKERKKTPPKIANYAEMKKEKERRSHQLQTLSQKQVYERLRSRQTLPQSPERGVNYLQLRELQSQH